MKRQSNTERLAAIPLFSGLTTKQLAAVDALVTEVHVEPGRELIRQGEIGREFFLVVDGEAQVQRDGVVLANRGPGAFFGETALLLDQRRNARVVAITAMNLQVINQQDFRRLVGEHPELRSALFEATARHRTESGAAS